MTKNEYIEFCHKKYCDKYSMNVNAIYLLSKRFDDNNIVNLPKDKGDVCKYCLYECFGCNYPYIIER